MGQVVLLASLIIIGLLRDCENFTDGSFVCSSSTDLVERTWRTVMTMKGISVERNTAIRTISIIVVRSASRPGPCPASGDLQSGYLIISKLR